MFSYRYAHDSSWVITSDTRRDDLEQWAYWERIDGTEAHTAEREPEPVAEVTEPAVEPEAESAPATEPEPATEAKPARRARSRKADA